MTTRPTVEPAGVTLEDLRAASPRAFKKIRVLASGCWQWLGNLDYKGYGQIMIGGKGYRAHRHTWTVLVSEIPPGMVIDHQCRNRGCVNPAHLKVVTTKQNALENSLSITALNAQKDR